LSDSRAIIAAAERAGTAAILGASFIGLEVAAALRARGLAVHVLAPEATPMERTLGRELGQAIRAVHEQNGVIFHLGQTAEGFDRGRLRLGSGEAIACDFLVSGVGVTPRVEIAKAAGLALDGGVVVDSYLETSCPGVFAAGDIARYPHAHTGEKLRVEHWVVAERQGQAAAANMLGERSPYTAPPFFWSNHYDLAVRYVGHAREFERTDISGSIEAADATVRFIKGGKVVAAASIGRDRENLAIEVELGG
jgi:NADPH-dependent 2,4-dienoyl-CoA reductase/sulfur reductase-like enzyme